MYTERRRIAYTEQPPDAYQASVVKRADGGSAGAEGPSENQVVSRHP
jgi:hypothetical protein